MSVASAAAAGRRAAEARMTSRVIVRRLAERDQQDEETGEEAAYWQVVYTDLPFRMVASRVGGSSHTVRLGDVEFEQATASGHFPANTRNLADDDLLEVTSGEWAGSVYRIVEAVKGDQRTARRVPVVEVDRPEEW